MPKINAHEHNSSDENDSSSSEEEHRRRKLSKKHKSKKAKKLKKKKKEKSDQVRKNKNGTTSTNQSSEVLGSLVPVNPSVTEDASVFGPSLPPHLLNLRTETIPSVIGPVLPSHILNKSEEDPENQSDVLLKKGGYVETEEESNDGMIFGPTLVNDQKITNPTQLKLEERALALKLAAIDGSNSTGEQQKVREEWMLELPEVGLKGGLAALNNMKRTFYQGKDRPDFSDRSAWTNTPMTSANATAEKPNTSKDLEKTALALYEHQRNEEQERIARKHKKKNKRDESLVEIHQKKLRKEQRKKLKELAASGFKPERRPFSRDVDLKLNKIDSHQTKQIVDKAKILNTKFSSGHSKYL